MSQNEAHDRFEHAILAVQRENGLTADEASHLRKMVDQAPMSGSVEELQSWVGKYIQDHGLRDEVRGAFSEVFGIFACG